MTRSITLAMLLALAAPAPLTALAAADAGATHRQTVQFAKGKSSAQVRGSIKGDRDAEYTLNARAGQTLAVALKTSNASAYFNIKPPGSKDAAMFIGSSSGNEAKLLLPADGSYVVQVYLMRNAARRNERATYKLSINVDNSVTGQTQAPSQTTSDDFADGLSGGPDHWRVTGLNGDTLNVRATPSTSAKVLTVLYEGDVVRNLGCKRVSSARWCGVVTDTGLRGWVNGKFLHEDFADEATTLPAFPVRPIQVQPAVGYKPDAALLHG